MTRSRLTPDQIRSIFISCEPAHELAVQYGVHIQAIYRIQSRTSHAWLTADLTRPKPTRLPPDLVRSIFTSAERPRVLISRYGIDRRTIWAIQSRATYARVTADLTRPAPPPRPVKPAKKPHLKPEQIRAIFASTESARELASQFSVSTYTIYAIQSRVAHATVTADLPDVIRIRRRGPARKRKPKPETHRPNIVITLTDDQIKSIFTSAESDRAEAERYKVKLGLIQNIRDRKMFAYTTMDLRRPRSATEPEPDQPDQKLGPSRGRFPPTPGIDFEQLKASHRNLRRPRLAINTKKIRIKPGYDDAPTIYAYLIPVHTRN